jgi:hypothetical protein
VRPFGKTLGKPTDASNSTAGTLAAGGALGTLQYDRLAFESVQLKPNSPRSAEPTQVLAVVPMCPTVRTTLRIGIAKKYCNRDSGHDKREVNVWGSQLIGHWQGRVQFAFGSVLFVWATAGRGQALPIIAGDGYDIDRLYPAPAGDRFAYVSEPRIRDKSCRPIADREDCGGVKAKPPLPCWTALRVLGAYQFGIRTVRSDDDKFTKSFRADTARLHVGASWAPYKWAQFSTDIPIVLYQTDLSQIQNGSGYGLPAGSDRVGRSPALFDVGDVRFGARTAFQAVDHLRFGLQGLSYIPTGDHERLTGDRTFRWDVIALIGFDEIPLAGGAVFSAVYFGPGWRPDMTSNNRPPLMYDQLGAGLGWDYQNIFRGLAEFRGSNLAFRSPAAGDATLGTRINFLPRNPSGAIWLGAHGTIGIGSSALGVPKLALAVDVTLIPWMD